MYVPDDNERKILRMMVRNVHATPKEIARSIRLDENAVKRIYNRMFSENLCSQVILPNYAALGFRVMMVQRLSINSNSLHEMAFITSKIRSDWKNCIDCHETFDGKIYVRSVWRSAEDFKEARTRFHELHGMDWLAQEEVDMIPLNENRSLIDARSPWEDETDETEAVDKV